MGFAPVNYSSMFDKINELTTKKDIVRELKRSTGKRKKYLETLFDLHKIHNDKIVWFIDDLEKFFNRPLDVMPFFRPEFFVGGWDYNATEKNGRIFMYVSACGLKKMLLILMLGERIE